MMPTLERPAPIPVPRHPRSVILFHWAAAGLIAFLAASGWTMTRLPPGGEAQFALYQFHKAAGIAVLLVSLARLAWRPFAPPLPLVAATSGPARLARLVHATLFALTLVVPLAGWALVSVSRLDIPVDLVAGLVWPRIPVLADLAPVTKAFWEPVIARAHVVLATGLVALSAMHAAAAMFHHVLRADATLRRMLPFAFVPCLVLASPVSQATDWTVDRDRSTLGFVGTETGVPFQGRFTRWTARISFDPAHPQEARIDAEVDIASATTGETRRDAVMRGEEWLDAAGFPRALFSATGFRPIGEGVYEAAGTLALRDQRRPVVLRFALRETPEGTRARGGATLIRTAYGIGRGRWSGLQFVAAEVAVEFDLLARQVP